MSNYIEYNDKIAFHPGYYIKEIIDDSGLTQEDFAKRLGTTPKNLSILIRGEQSLSIDIATKLSRLLGISLTYWLGLQQAYDEKIADFLSQEELKKEKEVFKQIDYKYFRENFRLPDFPRKVEEQIKALRELKDVDDKENMYNVFDLYTVGNIDEKSLYTRTFNKDKATVIKSTIPEVNDEEIDIEFENIMREDIFSKKKINDYVGLLLNKSNVINIKDIAINDFDDIIMLVMIQLYSQYDDMIYSINFLEQEDNKLGFKDFEIIRRNKE